MTENKIIENIDTNISNENLVNSEELELSNLKPEELIISLDQLIDNHNPFAVSKRVENINYVVGCIQINKKNQTLVLV